MSISTKTKTTRFDTGESPNDPRNQARGIRSQSSQVNTRRLTSRELGGHYDQIHPKSIPSDIFYSDEPSDQGYQGKKNNRKSILPNSTSQNNRKSIFMGGDIDDTESDEEYPSSALTSPVRTTMIPPGIPESASPQLEATYASGGAEPGTESDSHNFYNIKVVMGLMSNLPDDMCITKSRAPCALFSIQNSQSGNVEGYFVKEYSQLLNFSNVVVSILLSLIRTGEVKLTKFPHKSLFMREVPWRVDVRTDMLNAFFKSLSQARETQFVKNNSYIKSALDQACSALWLYDIVELPNSDDDQHMCGYLMSKSGSNRWSTNYCIINGAFVDVMKNSTCPPVTKSISLKGARIISKIVFFNTTDEDERYAFHIYEKLPTSGYLIHRFSAESEKVRQMWLSKLREVVQLIDSQQKDPKLRDYADSNLPMPYKLKHSPHLSAYLPEVTKDSSVNDLVSKAAANSSEASFVGESVSVEQPIQKKKKKKGKKSRKEEGQFFDGEDFYMQISKPVESKLLDAPLASVPENDASAATAGKPGKKSGSGKNANPGISISQPSPVKKPEVDSVKAIKDSPNTDMKTSVTPKIMALRNAVPNQVPKGKVFGRDPGSCRSLLKCHGDNVPSIIARCVQALSNESALAEVGLFRISGTLTLVEQLQTVFNLRGDCDFNKYQPDVHSVADLLKRYLRSLPHSILGNWSTSEAQALFEQDRQGQIRILNVVLMNKDPVTISTIKCVLHLLKNVSKYESANSMSIWNLSVALSTCLKVPPRVVQTFIQIETDLFGPISQLEWSIVK